MTLLTESAGSNAEQTKLTPRKQVRKVLHVVNGEHYAGAARVQDLLALSLPAFGYEVSFACVFPDKFAEKRKSQDAPLYNFPMTHRLDFRPARQIARLVASEGYDLIHSHTTRSSMIASSAARMAGVPYVHHVHCQMDTEVGQRLKSLINKKLEQRACRRADKVIAVSDSVKAFLLRNQFCSTPIDVVPNGVPSPEVKKPLRLNGQPWTIGMVALLRERKGLETLMHAMPTLSSQFNVRLRIVGSFVSEEYRQAMLQLAENLGISSLIDWTGFTDDVNSEVCQMDVLVLPSVLPEGMPMVLLEAMAAGVPVVGSQVDGITDVIRHQHNGLLADAGDPASLATQLTSIMNGHQNWNRLREECLADYQERYSDEAMAASVACVYDDLLDMPNQSSAVKPSTAAVIKSTVKTNVQATGCAPGFLFSFWGGRGWTELAKETPGFHSCLVPTPATLSKPTIIHERAQATDYSQVPVDLQKANPFVRRFHTWKASLTVKACVPCSRFLTAPKASSPGILMYHRVVPDGGGNPSWNVTPQRFCEQLSGLLNSGYQPWSLSRLVEASTSGTSIPDNVFVVTFDDGYANNFTYALPILRELNIPATIFLATSYIGSTEPFPFDDWPEKGSPDVDPDTWRALTMDECHGLLDSGLIELGSHTHTHEDFRNRPDAFRDSLRTSMDFLLTEFGITRPTLSLPYGIVREGFAGPSYFDTAKSEGATCCLTTEEELLKPSDSPFGWGRFIAEDRDTAAMLSVKLDGWRDAARDVWRRVRGK